MIDAPWNLRAGAASATGERRHVALKVLNADRSASAERSAFRTLSATWRRSPVAEAAPARRFQGASIILRTWMANGFHDVERLWIRGLATRTHRPDCRSGEVTY